MISIALYNLKGGVGKTTTAVNLAHLAAVTGKSTVLWDWDPQAAASWYFGVDSSKTKTKAINLVSKNAPLGTIEVTSPYPNLTLIPADISLRKVDAGLVGLEGSARTFMRKLVEPLSESTSVLIFDCPPTINPSMEYLLSGVDLMLVPMIPSPLSLRAMRQVIEFFAGKKHAPKRIFGFFNMVDTRRSLHKKTLEDAKNLPLPVMKAWVPMASSVEQMSERRAPLTSYSRRGREVEAYQQVWREVVNILKRR